MKEVTVYTVQAHQTWATNDYGEYFKQVQLPPLVGVGDNDSKTFISPERIVLPVHHICRHCLRADGTPQQQEEFIAIDRDLLRVLEMVIRSNENELQQEVATLQKKNNYVANLYYDLKSQRDTFSTDPLWRRLWTAIRPGRLFG